MDAATALADARKLESELAQLAGVPSLSDQVAQLTAEVTALQQKLDKAKADAATLDADLA